MTDDPTHYEILEVAPDADATEIRAAYRRLARTTHPDMNAGTTHIFTLVKRAYEVLSDPAQRAEYDSRIGRRNDTTPEDVDVDIDIDEEPDWGTEDDWQYRYDVPVEDPLQPPPPFPPRSPHSNAHPAWMDAGWTDQPPPSPQQFDPRRKARRTRIWCTVFAIVTALCLGIWTFEYPVGTICAGVIAVGVFGSMLSRRHGADTSVVMTLTYIAAAVHVILGGFILLSADGPLRIVGMVWMGLYLSYIMIGRKTWEVLGTST